MLKKLLFTLLVGVVLAHPASASSWGQTFGRLIQVLRTHSAEPRLVAKVLAPESQYVLTETVSGRMLLTHLNFMDHQGLRAMDKLTRESKDLLLHRLADLSDEYRHAMRLRRGGYVDFDPQTFLRAAARKYLPELRFSDLTEGKIVFLRAPTGRSGDLVARFRSGSDYISARGTIEARLDRLAERQRGIFARYSDKAGRGHEREALRGFTAEFDAHWLELLQMRNEVQWHWRLTGERGPAQGYRRIWFRLRQELRPIYRRLPVAERRRLKTQFRRLTSANADIASNRLIGLAETGPRRKTRSAR